MTSSFTHLHVHTEYSMLDGAARLDDLVAAAAADGQPALGITDHGNMYGVLDFYRSCRKHEITPVIGCELYTAHEHRSERPSRRGRLDDSGGETEGGKKLYYHLTALAENNTGYKNLIQLASRAFMEGYYYKPRVDWEVLAEHSEGVIATTGCLGGHVLQSLLQGDERAAVEKAARLQDIFGRDNLFVELQDHGIPEQHQTNPQLLQIAKRIKAPILVTNDSHYTHQHDHTAHDALLCVQTGSLISDPNRFKFHGDQHYLKSAAEMRHLFAEIPEACDNTLWIAERAKVEIEFGKPQLPDFPIPEGFESAAAYLEHLTFEGARTRWGQQLPDSVVERLAYELDVIKNMGFSSYFLITWDLIRHARDTGIRVGPGRGSAAGCAVAYCLWITDLDPIKYDLLFERFLNPSRISMPDIDMDFDSRYRDEMIRYAAERYGRDHVAQIVTFSQIKARAAVRDAARVLGYPYAVGDKVAKAMPPLIMGRDTPLRYCFEEHPKYVDGFKMAGELRQMVDDDPDVAKVVDVAKGLEGLRRSDGIHAAAVVITKDPLTTYLPIQRKPEAGQDVEDAPVVTQYEMHGVEDLGLLKMDFLGLRNLDVITDTLQLIEKVHGTTVDIDAVPLDDEPTYELLRAGQSIGVFQLEGGPMRALMRSLAPTSFEDVAALVALYRPGPMSANMHNDYADRKNGRKAVEYLHPDAQEILGDTYGLCLTGDTIVFDALSGTPTRLDQVPGDGSFLVQGVDEDLRTAVRPVSRWVCNGRKSVVTLRTANGATLSGTRDHRVLTDQGWCELDSLRPGDYVAAPSKLIEPVLPSSTDPATLRLLGYLLADGSLSVRSAVTFINTDPKLLDEFEHLVGRSFPSCRCARDVDANGVTRITVGNGKGNGGGPSPLLSWLRDLGLKAAPGHAIGGPKSAQKRTPSMVFALDDHQVGQFLGSLWDCDGHVGERIAFYKTVSSGLAEDVRLLLVRLGFAPVISRSETDGVAAYQVSVYDSGRFAALIAPFLASDAKRDAPFVAESKATSIPRSLYVTELLAVSATSQRALREKYSIPRSGLTPYAVARHPRIHARSTEPARSHFRLPQVERLLNVTWVEVVGVEDAGEQVVYDITVDEIHNFVANGLVVHNCIYQEGIMRIAQKFAGYTLAEADNLRKACGKKIRELIVKERTKFVEGCETNGYGRALGDEWFDIIEPFADYAFNKSHSYGYGLVSYQTAYLKANYPVEYLACLLTSVKNNLDKAAVYLNECRQMGIKVLVPDINRSERDFASIPDPEGGELNAIPFGLSAVRNVGEGLVELILGERRARGPFASFVDFVERVDYQVLNKRTIESLIKAGAFDSLGHPRKGLLLVFEDLIDKTIAARREHDMGVMTLFGGDASGGPSFDDRPAIPAVDFDKSQRLAFEKEMLGLYVSDHPLMGLEVQLRRRAELSIADLETSEEGSSVTVGGVVTGLQRKWTKKGDLMAVFTLEDLTHSAETMVFPRTMTDFGHLLEDDRVVIVRGRVDKRDDQPKLMAQTIEVFEPVSGGAPPLRLEIRPEQLSEALIARLKRILSEHSGDAPVFIHLSERQAVQLSDDYCVDTSNGLIPELRVMLGADAVLL